jgi:methylmalonyl-CoA epimerase
MPHLDHLGLAVDAPEAVTTLFETLLGARPYKQETVSGQGVRTHFIAAGSAKLELLESITPDSPIARFLARHGEGMHHLAFEVDDVEATMAHCRTHGFTPLSDTPQPGADGKLIFFLHPKDTHGLLIEFCQSVPAPLEPSFIPYDDGQLAVYEGGAPDAAPVLLLHGAAGCTQLETAPLLRRLELHHRVLAVDFSSHGASTDDGTLSADRFADNARAVLDAKGIGQADVFGFSMGGYVALHLTHQHPDRVRRLAIHGTNIEWDDERVEAMQRRMNVDRIEQRRPDLVIDLDTVHGDWAALFRRMQGFVATLPEHSAAMRQIASSLHHPTLVSTVDRDDLFALDATLDLTDRLPTSVLAVIPGNRHALQHVNLDLLTPILRRHFGKEQA